MERDGGRGGRRRRRDGAQEGRRRPDHGQRQRDARAHAARGRLVDVVALQVFPVAIGGGLRFWPEERGKVDFRLDDLVQLDNGVLLQRFRTV